jgi:hypothetical protein
VLLQINACHIAAGCLGEADCELADQAKPDHHDASAWSNLCEAQAVQRNGGDSCEGRLSVSDLVWDWHRKVGWHELVLSVTSRAGDDTLTRDDSLGRLADGNNRAHTAVAERHFLIQTRAHGAHRVCDAVGTRSSNYLAHQIGSSPGLG